MMDTVLAILVGLGLAAACGFRVFVPLLVMSVAAHAGHLTLTPGFAWVGSDAALISFAVAAVLEVGEKFSRKFPAVTASEVRLNILEATEGPTITEFRLLPPGR